MAARIIILLTGGTLLMQEDRDGLLHPDTDSGWLLDELPVLARVGRIELRPIASLDSADMQPPDWQTIARATHAALADDEVDGVVVVHGTDTMAYTASALALMLGPLPKPVVLTGAQRPLREIRTDARANLVDACLLATMPVPEVGVAFGSRLLRGARSTKRDAWALHAFDSPSCPPLVDLGLSATLGAHVRAPSKLAPLDDRIESRVLAVRVFPGLDPVALERALAAGLRGLVLEGYGTGTLPHLGGSLIPVVESATASGVPVLVVSQCFRGVVELERYAGGMAAQRAGAISGGDMTVEASIAKMMIGLGRGLDRAAMASYLATDIVGERS